MGLGWSRGNDANVLGLPRVHDHEQSVLEAHNSSVRTSCAYVNSDVAAPRPLAASIFRYGESLFFRETASAGNRMNQECESMGEVSWSRCPKSRNPPSSSTARSAPVPCPTPWRAATAAPSSAAPAARRWSASMSWGWGSADFGHLNALQIRKDEIREGKKLAVALARHTVVRRRHLHYRRNVRRCPGCP